VMCHYHNTTIPPSVDAMWIFEIRGGLAGGRQKMRVAVERRGVCERVHLCVWVNTKNDIPVQRSR
jgi:hypothetical protein